MKKNKGVLTLEAALVVPMFMFFIFFMWTFMKVVFVYDTVQSNIYNTAKFINGYTYLLEPLGLNEKADNAPEFKDIFDNVVDVFNSSTKEEASELDEAINTLITSIIDAGINGATNIAFNESLQFIAQNSLESEFTSVAGDNYKQRLGISSDSIDFNESEFTRGSDGRISVVAKYNVKVEFPILNIEKEIPLTNKVVIKNFSGRN